MSSHFCSADTHPHPHTPTHPPTHPHTHTQADTTYYGDLAYLKEAKYDEELMRQAKKAKLLAGVCVRESESE
jgi:hypothetical protein